jgi:hypothetical protein
VLVTGMPDVGLTLVASGLVAIVWGLARTVMAFLALRKVDARSLSAKLIEAHQANHEVG